VFPRPLLEPYKGISQGLLDMRSAAGSTWASGRRKPAWVMSRLET
jgi:hypothetical protein